MSREFAEFQMDQGHSEIHNSGNSGWPKNDFTLAAQQILTLEIGNSDTATAFCLRNFHTR